MLTSQVTFPQGADTVVLARADLYPDALAAVPLADSVDGPILLTWTEELDPLVAEEIQRLGATGVVMVGGSSSLSPTMLTTLRDLGVTNVDRIAGSNRFETAALIAKTIPADHVYVVEGDNPDPRRGWPDALAVGPLAAAENRPILLMTTDMIPTATRQALIDLELTGVTIAGGPNAVSDAVLGEIDAITGEVDRVSGADRYATSLLLADLLVANGGNPGRAYIATGENFPDALTAGAAVAHMGGVLLLVNGTGDASAAGEWLAGQGSETIHLTVVGGTNSVGEPVMTQLRGAIGGKG